MGAHGKMYQSTKNRKSGKYRNQFLRTVKRTGKWRGKLASVNDVKSSGSSIF